MNALIQHEICGEDCCHDYHQNPMADYRTCDTCAQWLKDRADQAGYQFHFTVEDVEKAEEWAAANKFRYDDVEHLLLDAYREKVINADHWKSI